MSEQPWAVSPAQAAELLGLNRRTFYRQVMPYVYSGVIESGKIGRTRRIDDTRVRLGRRAGKI